MSFWTVVSAIAGLFFLLIGAEVLVRGASALARRFGISPLVVGLTVVAFGTSSPELAVSLGGAFNEQAEIALGNVLGSNIFNVLLILGLSALIAPLVVAQRLVRREVPLMVAVSVATMLLALDGSVGLIDGLLLFGAFIAYTVYVLRESRHTERAVVAEYEAEFSGPESGGVDQDGGAGEESTDTGSEKIWIQLLFVVVGLGLLVLGSTWFVDGAIAVARTLEVSEVVISLTIVAAGTSLPELATSVMAAFRGERDIAVGNVVGSNLFNLMAFLGLTAIVSPAAIPVSAGVLAFDFPVMIAAAVACLPAFFSGYTIDRWEGAIFLAYYIAYTGYLALAATEHAVLGPYSTVVSLFVIPLTVLTLIIIAVRSLRAGRRGEETGGDKP
jgi:cation:H+ antiporter